MKFIGRVFIIFLSKILWLLGLGLAVLGIIALILSGTLWWIAVIVIGVFVVAIAAALRGK